MKKSIIAIYLTLTSIAAFSQPVPKTGMSCANEVIYDSGGVSIKANQTQVTIANCSSIKDVRVCIFKCEFTIKNILSVPVTINGYDFMVDPKNAGYVNDPKCGPKEYGDTEKSGSNLHLEANSTMVVDIYGETPYDNNPKCCYVWVFKGFTVNGLVGK